MPDRPPKDIPQLWGPKGVVYLDKDDFEAFKDWQRLSKEEKRGLINMAENHRFILNAAKTFMFLGMSGKVLISGGTIGTALLAIYGAGKLFGIIP